MRKKGKGIFFTIHTPNYGKMAKGLVNSFKKFYPNGKIIKYEVENYCYDALKTLIGQGKQLIEEYGRAIYLEADSIVCSQCPELFGDFELGMPVNNTPYGNDKYLNMGLISISNPKILDEVARIEIEKRPSEGIVATQNAFNEIYREKNYKTKVLEFPDKSYGIQEMFNYPYCRLEGEDLMVGDKKLCIFHAAGGEWKGEKNGEGEISFWKFKNEEVKKKLKELIS